MNSRTDQQLLRDYAVNRSEAAFAELVRRHVDAVYSAALRLTRDESLAKDIAQGAFLALAQNAAALAAHPVLSGWLHCTTRNLAANAIRAETRRVAREQEAAVMNEILAGESEATWEQLAPHLDAALGELNDTDRDAVMLRYFERKTAAEIAGLLAISEEAAQKRVSRAVERLREFLAKRGITVGASGLVGIISTNAVQVAPLGLAATLTSTSLAGTAAATASTLTLLKWSAITKFQLGAITALVVAVGTVVIIRQKSPDTRPLGETAKTSSASNPLNLTNGMLPSSFARTKRAASPSEPEPLYFGKTLSEWMADLRSGNAPLKQTAFDTLIAIGPPAIPALKEALEDIRTVNSAAFILASIGKESLPVLFESLTNGPSLARREILGAGVLQAPALLPHEGEIVPFLAECMRDEDATVRGGAVNALQSYGKKQPELVMPALIDCLTDTNTNVRGSAVTVIRQFGLHAAPAISNLVWLARQDTDSFVRTRAAESLRVLSPERAEKEGF